MKNNFEKELEELEKIVNELEKGNVPLEDAIEKYTKAMEIAKKCSDTLKNAQEQVNKIVLDNGEIKDFEVTE